MPSSWRAWARTYLGDSYAPPTPANQEFVAAAKFRTLYRSLGSWRRVAYWWLTGSSQTYGWSYAASHYVSRVMTYYASAPSGIVASPSASTATTHWISDSSASVIYAGTWRTASYGGYAGGAVHYATAAGATASVSFTGTRIAWYGPTGPTRGQARIFIDGSYVGTVNLYRSGFTARSAAWSTSWTTAASHTLRIQVVGTPGHPMVAIDQFVVTN
jgi:hypothetical protein